MNKAQPPDPNSQTPRGRVLLVDDEPQVLASLQRQLRRTFEVFTANRGETALRILQSKAIDVIVCDQRMPDMNGAEVLAAARQQKPDCTRIILTGYSDQQALVDAVNRAHIHGYITKPWNQMEIRGSLDDAVQSARLRAENRRLTSELESVNAALALQVAQRTAQLSASRAEAENSRIQRQQTETRFRDLFEQARDGIAVLDLNGRILDANRQFCSLLGYSKAECRGRHFSQVYPPDSVALRVGALGFSRLLEDGQVSFESTFINRSGNTFPVALNCNVVDSGGRRLVHALVHNLIERRQHEAFAALQRRRAEALMDLPGLAESLDETGFLQRAQALAVDLTESRMAFIHFVSEDETSIRLVTGSPHALPRRSRDTFPVEQAGVWSNALRQRKAVVFNDPLNEQHTRGLPPDYAELHRLISVPVIDNGKVVMLSGVGNKANNYTYTDVETMQLISNALWRNLQRRRYQIALTAKEARYRELVNNLSDGVSVYQAIGDGQDFTIRDFNRTAEHLAGVSRERIIGTPVTQAFPGVRAMGLLKTLNTVWKTSQAVAQPASLYQHGDFQLWVENYVFKLPDGDIVAVWNDVTARKQAEREIRDKNRLLEILFKLSAEVINLPLKQVDAVLEMALKEMAEFNAADRAYIFEYDFTAGTASNTFEWCATGITAQREHLQNVPLNNMPEWVATHCDGKPVEIADVDALTTGAQRDLLRQQGIKSLLALPMIGKRTCLGFVGMDWVRDCHACGEQELQLLRLFSELLVNITERRQSDTERNAQLEELRRWHDVTLGRETRVLELKREINAVLARHGEAPRYRAGLDQGVADE